MRIPSARSSDLVELLAVASLLALVLTDLTTTTFLGLSRCSSCVIPATPLHLPVTVFFATAKSTMISPP